MPDCDQDGLIGHSSKGLGDYTRGLLFTCYPSENWIICSPFVQSIIFWEWLSLLPNGGHLICNETRHCFSPRTSLSFLFFLLLVYFPTVPPLLFGPLGAPCRTAVYRPVRQPGSHMSVRAESACHSLSPAVSLPSGLNSAEVNISRGGCTEKHFPFSHCSQMSILVFHTARHFPALSNRSASHCFQPMQKINDIIAT